MPLMSPVHSYVDEVQDNLLIDTLSQYAVPLIYFHPLTHVEVLRAICRRPEGLFWAGDTAQTISAGCSFRFSDLRAIMFRVEVRPPLFASMTELNSCTFLARDERS